MDNVEEKSDISRATGMFQIINQKQKPVTAQWVLNFLNQL